MRKSDRLEALCEVARSNGSFEAMCNIVIRLLELRSFGRFLFRRVSLNTCLPTLEKAGQTALTTDRRGELEETS